MSVFSRKLRLQTNSRDGPLVTGDTEGDRGKEALNIELEPPEVKKHVKEFAKEFLDEYPHGPPSCPYKGKSKSCKKVMKGLPGLLNDDSIGGDVISETGGGSGGPVEASPSKEFTTMSGLREKMNLGSGRGHEAKPPKEIGFQRDEADAYLDQEPEFPIVDVDPEDISIIELVDDIAPEAEDYEEALEEEAEEDDTMEVDAKDVEVYEEDDDDEPESAMEVSEDDVEFIDDDEDDEDDERARESCDKQGPPVRGREYATREHEAADAEEEADMDDDEEIVEVSEEEVEPVSECPTGCVPAPTFDEPTEEEVMDDVVEEEELKEAEVVEPEENAMIYETISLDKVSAGADVNDVTLFLHGEDGENPHYVVLVDGDPVAKIALADQQLPPEHLGMFLDEHYPEFILEGIESFGLSETLNSVHARYYAASALKSDVAVKMREAAATDMEESRKVAMSDLKDHLISTAAVVIEGSMKNYITDNPLKDALIRQMARVSVDENTAVDLIEDAWREAAVDYVTAMLNKAEEWLGAPKEVMDHHIKEITGMSYRHPGYRAASDEIPEYDDVISESPIREKVAAMQVPSNVPLRTAAPSPTGAGFHGDKDYWKKQMNLTGRHMNQSLASFKSKK